MTRTEKGISGGVAEGKVAAEAAAYEEERAERWYQAWKRRQVQAEDTGEAEA